MVRVGSAAPHFDATAVVEGHLVPLRWRQLHEDRTLVLLFDPIGGRAHSPEYLIAVSNAVARRCRPHAKLAVVWRNGSEGTLAWANRPRAEGGPGALAFPLIADPAGRIAALYDPSSGDGAPLWHRFLIDPTGSVRHAAVSSFPAYASVDDLLEIIDAVGCPAGRP
jgi:peroxiredoxin (alkyl hydroperoxide reductase subunit C)